MSDTTVDWSWRLGAIVLLAAILGAALFAAGQWLYDEVTEPQTFTGESTVPEGAEEEPVLQDALDEAVQEAVEFEDGKYKGDSFEITRVELTTSNPHVTAYRVVIAPTG